MGANKRFRTMSIGDKIFEIILFAFMIYIIVVTLYPFLNLLAISFNESLDANKGGIGIIPRKFTLNNYIELTKYSNLMQGFFISVMRTVVGTLSCVVCSCMLAYTISRFDFMFRKSITVLFVITMYVSGGLIPDYVVMRGLGLVNTFWVYILPGLVGVWNLIVMRSFILQLPYSLQEAAHIDGANDWHIFYKIIMPLSLPVIATVSLFVAVGQWNSWFDTYIYATYNDKLTTLQYELMKILQSAASAAGAHTSSSDDPTLRQSVSPTSIKMAITVVSTVPILCVYPFIQRYFVTGMTMGAVKA